MPAFVKTPHDEELWAKAKQRAAEEGHEEDWAYITGIFKRMKGGHVGKGALALLVDLEKGKVHVKAHTRRNAKTGVAEEVHESERSVVGPSHDDTVAAMAAQLEAAHAAPAYFDVFEDAARVRERLIRVTASRQREADAAQTKADEAKKALITMLREPGEEVTEFWARQKEVGRQANALRAEAAVAERRVALRGKDEIRSKDPGRLVVHGQHTFPTETARYEAEHGLDDFAGMIDSKAMPASALDGSLRIQHFDVPNTRTCYQHHGFHGTHVVKIHANEVGKGSVTMRRAIVHELGHWFEMANPANLERSVAFWKSRTGGDRYEALAELSPYSGYRAEEMTKKDEFEDPYMGKVYADAAAHVNMPGEADRITSTEIVSMGLEQMYVNPVALARKNPELFDLIWSPIRRAPS